MANFLPAFQLTMGHEGAYSNNPADRGGETYCGISRKFFPNWAGWVIIDKLKPSKTALSANTQLPTLVQEFYRTEFWNRIHGAEISSQSVAEELFDSGVNMASRQALEFLQMTLNRLNKNGTIFPDMKVDGGWGPTTASALKTLLSNGDEPYIVMCLNGYQFARYDQICANDPTQEVFFRGWVKRAQARLAGISA